jgi:glycosyltransferase involved in cell wall biosynthesis
MNILLLTTHFNEGGISRYCLNLAGQLQKKGHRIYVASSGGGLEGELAAAGIEHIKINLRTKSELSPKIWCALSQLKKPLAEKNIQLIHAQTRVAQVLACWIYKFYKIPYVTTCHGFFRPRFFRRAFPCWGRKVIAISHAVERHLIDDFKVAPGAVKYVPNGLDVNRFKVYDEPAELDYKNKMNLGQGPVVGIIARLSPVKGHRFLLEAMAEVVKEFPDAMLLIVGDGPLKEGLIKLSRELKISENVAFSPAVVDTSLVLSVIDIFVMPSLQEGLGLSIMEAMAKEIAVIASNVGGIPDLIKDNQTGLLVPPRDSICLARAMLKLLKDRNLEWKLGQNGREFIQKEFTITRMVDGTEAVYREVLNQKVT